MDLEPLFGLPWGDDVSHIIETSREVSSEVSSEVSEEDLEIALAPELTTLGVKKVTPGNLKGRGARLVKDIYHSQQKERNMIDITGNYPIIHFNDTNQKYLRYGNIYENGRPVELFETLETCSQEVILTHKTTKDRIYGVDMLFVIQVFVIKDAKVQLLDVLTSSWFSLRSHSKQCKITRMSGTRKNPPKRRKILEDESEEESFSV